MSTIVRDAFGRIVANGWGTPDTGAAYTGLGTAGNYSVDGSVGRITAPAANLLQNVRVAQATADVSVVCTIALDAVPAGSADTVWVMPRWVDVSNNLRCQVGFLLTGAVTLTLGQIVAGAATTLATVTVPGLVYTGGARLRLVVEAVGTAFRAWLWPLGTTQPATPTLTATTTGVATSGFLNLIYQTIAGATSLPRTATFDDMWAVDAVTAVAVSDSGAATEDATMEVVRAFPPPIVALSWESGSGETVDLQGDPQGIRVNIVEGLDELPAMRTIDDIVPFRAGRLRQRSMADRRALVLAGYVKTPDDWSYRPIVARLQRALDPAVGAGTLTAVLEDGGVRTIGAVPVDITYVGRIRTGKNLSIELDADPYWRGATLGEAWVMDMGLWMDEALVMDTAPGGIALAPTSSPYAATFVTLGTTDTLDARVEVDGPSTGAVTVVNADGVGFGYPALTGGQTLVVDAGARTATIGVTRVRQSLSLLSPNEHGEFFRVRPDSDTFTVTGRPAAVRVIHKPTYL